MEYPEPKMIIEETLKLEKDIENGLMNLLTKLK